jgi:hypothetical protein
MRAVELGANDPAVITPAITEMPAIRHIDRIAHDQQRTAFILIARIEFEALLAQSTGDIDRPAGQNRTIAERQAEKLM